jgi:hypothetical protein
MKHQLIIIIALTLAALNSFAAPLSYECKGTSPNVRNETLQVHITDDQVRLTDAKGLDLNGSQDKAFVPRSRKNYTRFELKAGPTLLVEQAMLEGGYELRDGGRGGYIQTETQNDDGLTRADYLCQQK